MTRLFSILLIAFSLTACAKPQGTQETLANQCIWNMVGYGCGGVDSGRPNVAAAPDQR